jgi:hypothetical protein
MGAKKRALKALRRKFPRPRHPKLSPPLKRAVEEQESEVRRASVSYQVPGEGVPASAKTDHEPRTRRSRATDDGILLLRGRSSVGDFPEDC